MADEKTGPITNVNFPIEAYQQWAKKQADLAETRKLISAGAAQSVGQTVSILDTIRKLPYLSTLFETYKKAEVVSMDAPPGFNEQYLPVFNGYTEMLFGSSGHLRTLQSTVQLMGEQAGAEAEPQNVDAVTKDVVVRMLQQLESDLSMKNWVQGRIGSLVQG